MNDTTNLFNYKKRLADAKNQMDALPRGARAKCARYLGVYPSRVSRVLNYNTSDINGLLAILDWLEKETVVELT